MCEKSVYSYADITCVYMNGSNILPNGIVVLVQADLEAYENGTLQFYNAGDQTQTE